MADILKLGKARKQRDRQREQAQAAENRVRHGRTKAERLRDQAEAERLRRLLDQARQPD